MKRKIKFPLNMGNEIQVRSIEELRNNFNLDRTLKYLLSGKLKIWLKHRGYKHETEQIEELEDELNKLAEQLCKIIGVDYEKYILLDNKFDIEEIKNISNKTNKVDEYLDISEDLDIDNKTEMFIECDKFTVRYRKSVVECKDNMTIIDSNGNVKMLKGSQYDNESIPKFDSPIVDIDNQIALDENGKVYQWGVFCEQIPFNLPKVKQVSECFGIKIALDEFGKIHHWGNVMFIDVFKNMPQIDSKIVQVIGKGTGIIALDEFGKVYCWGGKNEALYNIPHNLPYIKKVQLINSDSAFVLDKDGKVHFWGDIPSDIMVPHMLPMIVDITVSRYGDYCIALDEKGKVHILNKDSFTYKFKPIEGIKYLTPYGGIDDKGMLHKYTETIGDYVEYSNIKVKIPNE